MIEVNRSEVKWHVTTTDGSNSFTIVGKVSVSTDQFDEVFFKFMTDSKTNKEAYEKTEQLHEDLLGYRKYCDFESFRVNKYKRDNERRKRNRH